MMTTTFLPDATDFTDLPVRTLAAFTDFADGSKRSGTFVLCPKCHGHGGWNLLLNQYGPGKHFQASCAQCWGWGWVAGDSTDATCLHDFHAIKPDQPFRCWHTDQCRKCGRTVSYSSDD